MDTSQLRDLFGDFLSNPVVQTLGIGGLLLAFVTFSIQLWRYGPAIKRLNKLEVLSQLYHLGETQKEMTRAFGEATAASCAMRLTAAQVQSDLDSLREFITDIQEQMSEYNADKITQARLELDSSELPAGTFFKLNPLTITPPKTPDQLFQSMKEAWDRFAEVFRRRLEEAGIDPKLNRIGKMTYMLSDRRRANPLPVETADLITALNSQYRRHLSLQRISATEHDNFVQLVQTAIDEVKKKRPRTDASILRNGRDPVEFSEQSSVN
jgi:hypothetical protein